MEEKEIILKTQKQIVKFCMDNKKIKLEKFLDKKRKKNFSIMRIAKTFGDEIKDKSIFYKFFKRLFKK